MVMAKKKKYSQSAQDRLAESRGMERYETKRKMEKKSEMYDGVSDYEMRMKREFENGGMIKEDPNAIANLPQQAMIKKYPKTDYFKYNLNDDIKGIDVQIDDDVNKELSKSRDKYPEKY